ncbi:hypothetical protein SAMN05192574_102254 [Mucilaginibacter gossypiicola]|uniref:Uncharacterized protein n=1 Tax=Mucilaginibacter gossypiicola TaxID=551995 RepID=A0A1H8D8W1_9SPHI|nr:hypothetical protein [Mucilaginibacter gossypiicola]SEN03662.1 hypothetical protein SAMN05192574_102254 [Mucilaginibacter gossypiicola]
MVIIITWLIAGSIDFAAALLLFVSVTKKKPALLLKAIASAALGPAAFSGGGGMAFLGLGFHYLIAFFWTIFYFAFSHLLFPCGAIITNAVFYGLFVWVIMNLVVLPLSKAEPRPFSPIVALVNIFILIVAIGLPCAYAAEHLPGFWFRF